jgi:hypothetical protein
VVNTFADGFRELLVKTMATRAESGQEYVVFCWYKHQPAVGTPKTKRHPVFTNNVDFNQYLT